MGICKNKSDGREFEFERSSLLNGRVIVDFDPGPELEIGIYSAQEFADTFDVVTE
jgi:hypothetical protein